MGLDAELLLHPEGPIARRISGYESRPQQTAMVRAVDSALSTRRPLLIEAGTGTGKSFGYLLPAVRRVLEHDERVVVVTHTIALQEQLHDKDVPLIRSVVPNEFSAVLVKGRNNYVSRRRMERTEQRVDRLLSDPKAQEEVGALSRWVDLTSDGTRTDLDFAPRGDVWDLVRSDSGNCMGRKCPRHDSCFYQLARRRMESGQLLICNHALFFSDLALRARGAGFLPAYDHVILDEAHAVEDVACEQFGTSLAEGSVRHLVRVLHDSRRGRAFLDTLELKEGRESARVSAVQAVQRLAEAAEQFFDAWERWGQQAEANGRIRAPGIVPDTLTPAVGELKGRLNLLRDLCVQEADGYEIDAYEDRCEDLIGQTKALVEQTISGCVYWLEGMPRPGDAFRRLRLAATAVDASPILREHLFGGKTGVVLTSATLTTGAGS
ncbi:MAG: DEAD/DEAH box helicase, partial [Planctomycetota bacterium]|nr:DEAD/DEAH box helicase [Planctomycetota bacterium]